MPTNPLTLSVLYITPGVFDKGGISRQGRFQIQALRDLLGPSRVHVLSLLGPTGTERDLEGSFPVDWHGAGDSASLHDKTMLCVRAIAAAVRLRPDVVWCGLMNQSAVGWLAAKLAGAALVTQVHGWETWTPRPGRPDTWWGLKASDYVVSVSHFTARCVEQKLARPEGSVDVMWNCVDSDRFSPASPDPAVLERYGIPNPEEGFNVLTLGRLSLATVYKGYERLLDVFPRLPPSARLIFGGSGDLVPQLKKRAQELRVAQRVVFTGFIHERDLPDVYRAASVFCLVGDKGPGRGEGIGLAPLEAAACGIPVLVSDQDGSQETAVNGVTGYVLDPFNGEALFKHLSYLDDNESVRRGMGQAARARIEREHAYSVYRERVRLFLDKVAARRTRGIAQKEETP
jgi:phosphatidylinositol alpha-1,6-mannosyltransferase